MDILNITIDQLRSTDHVSLSINYLLLLFSACIIYVLSNDRKSSIPICLTCHIDIIILRLNKFPIHPSSYVVNNNK